MDAIVLAGGKGSRLQPWHAPKTLLPICGVTILQRLLQHLLVVHGDAVERVVICTGYRASDIERSVRAHGWMDNSRPRVLLSDAGEAAAMGERLAKARELATGARSLICYGDELADVNVPALVAHHEAASAEMTVTSCFTSMPGGTMVGGGRVRIREDHPREVNIGFIVVEPSCWPLLKTTDGVSTWVNRVDNVHTFCHRGKRATVNSLADLEYAEQVWR